MASVYSCTQSHPNCRPLLCVSCMFHFCLHIQTSHADRESFIMETHNHTEITSCLQILFLTHTHKHTSVIDHLFMRPSLRFMKHSGAVMYSSYGIPNCSPLISIVPKQHKGIEKNIHSMSSEFLLKNLGIKIMCMGQMKFSSWPVFELGNNMTDV